MIVATQLRGMLAPELPGETPSFLEILFSDLAVVWQTITGQVPELPAPLIPTVPAQFKPPVAPRTEAEMRPGALFTPEDVWRLRQEEATAQMQAIVKGVSLPADPADKRTNTLLYVAAALGAVSLVLLMRK